MNVDRREVLFLETICNDPFWNASDILNAAWPRFTHCFRHIALSWPAPLLLMVIGLVRLAIWTRTIESLDTSRFKLTPLFFCRLVGCICLVGLTVAELVKDATYNDDEVDLPSVVMISHSIRLVAFIMACLILIIERRLGCLTSGTLFTFWTLLAITELLIFYEQTMEEMYSEYLDYFVINTVITSTVLIQLALSFITDSGGSVASEESHSTNKPWPTESVSFPSKLFFTWIVSIIFKSWRGNLKDDDIYQLPKGLECLKLRSQFAEKWKKVYGNDKRKLDKKAQESQTEDIPMQTFTNKAFVASDKSEVQMHPTNDNIPNGAGGRPPMSKPADKTKYPRSLIKTLLHIHGGEYSIACGQMILSNALTILQPLIARELILFVQMPPAMRQNWIGVSLGGALILVEVLKAILHNYSIYLAGFVGVKMKSAVASSIFTKAMTMSAQARKKFSAGDMITMMSVDTQRLQEAWRLAVMLAGTPLQIIVSGVLLYYTIGLSTLVGIAVIFMLAPLNVFLTAKMRRIQAINMALKSKRIKLVSDVLSGIKVLKLYAWEESFQEKITAVRQQEMVNLRKMSYLQGAIITSMEIGPYLVTLSTFATYVLISEDNHLDPATAFVSTIFFNIMRAPLAIVTFILAGIIMSMVSMERINRLMYGEDLEAYVGEAPSPGNAISVSEASFTWEQDGSRILHKLSMDVKENSLTMLVGKVGSGKSSLLSAILGEMRIVSGTVDLKGSVAYIAQQAWIQNATVRDNILFGASFDKARYRKIVKACAMEQDLKLLANGDLTEIGEKGINLSGGQKQRIALARAVYQDQDIYIFDDPLSALDSHVGKRIFKDVISDDGLLRGKTRLLVTHGAQWLPKAHTILMLEDGCLTHSGTYDELMADDSDFVQLLAQQNNENEEEEESDGGEDDLLDVDIADDLDDSCGGIFGIDPESETSEGDSKSHEQPKGAKMEKKKKESGEMSAQPTGDVEKGDVAKVKSKTELGRMTEAEKMQTGQVKWNVTLSWAKAGSLFGMITAVLALFSYKGVDIYSAFVLKFWTNDRYLANEVNSNTSEYADKNTSYLTNYGGVGVALLALVIFAMVTFWRSALLSSKRLHNGMLSSILSSPMSFFDTTPMGRLQNRFASDVDTMDSTFPTVAIDFVRFLIQVLGIIVVVCVNYPFFTAAIVPILILFYVLEMFYLPVARQIKRMEAVSKSPIYSHFNEALEGVSTIRAFGHVQRFLQESASKVDFSVIRSLVAYCSNSWLTICLDMLGTMFVAATTFFVVFSSVTDGASAGLCITYAMKFALVLGFMVRQQAEYTANSVALERILEYSDLPSEAERASKENTIPTNWPEKGEIKINDLQMRYRPGLELVLRGISTVIKPGEKVGIVGRTGAGKSSLTVALFRLVEPAGGSIHIDGVDIAKVGLQDLRSKLSILPQDPVLFAGSLRVNVDPFEEFPDDKVTDALSSAHLGDYVASLPAGLDHDVGEEGKNLSIGQRQLVCLARALLRQSCILVLDEATAAVDVETDSLIQDTIRTSFKDCTVLAIAHRLHTIMDYDRIMVLDAGHIAEMGPPDELLDNTNSLFYSLAKEANLVAAINDSDEDVASTYL